MILTFDAGAGKQSLDSILETLREYNIKASFFVTGQWVEKFPDGLRSIANAGHAIYNHTYSHPHFATLSDDDIKNELEKTDTLIKSIVGFDSKPYFRAPYGERNQRVLAVAASLGYRHAYWTIDAWDWKEGITAGEVKSRILQNVKPGTIYLMHVGDDISGAILPEIIQSIKKQGYEIVPLNQGATDH